MVLVVRMEKAKGHIAHMGFLSLPNSFIQPSLFPPTMEKFTHHCSSLCSSSLPSSRLNLAIVSTLLASIFFLTLRFSPNSFLTLLLLLLIPFFLFLATNKFHSLHLFLFLFLFDEKPQTPTEQQSAAQIGEQLTSDDETSTSITSNNGGLGSEDFTKSDLWMYLDELTLNLPLSEDSSSDDDSLIEIPLVPNAMIGNVESCLPDLLPNSVLRERGFVELLEEINEEDNLIEIDISKGFNRFSTVCN